MAENNAHRLLLPENIRRRLDPLMLVARKIRSGSMKGERRSVKRGTSIEFADYRNYTPGDDLRKLDWNVYARLQRPYIKLLEDEEDLAVHLLLDVSASMGFPRIDDSTDDETASQQKMLYAQRLFAALAYISLTTGDRLLMHALNDRGTQRFGPTRGKARSVPMLRYVHGLEAAGELDLNAALRDYALRQRSAGLVILITDMFAPNGYLDGLNALLGNGHEVLILHVLSPQDVNPPLSGDLRLIDVETDSAQEVTVDATMRHIYEQRLTNWLDSIRDECARRGVHYVMVQTDTPYEKVLLYELRRLGLIK